MRPQEKIICRLCLQICDNSRAIEGCLKDALDIVLPKIDLTVAQEPVMCTNCVELLMNCFDFKTTCLDTHDYIVPFVNYEDTIKLDLIDVYLSKNENVTSVPEDQTICGFCMSPAKNCSAIPLDVEDGNVFENMIERCLPELNLSLIKKPIICASCHCFLEKYFHFVTNCLIVEDEIKKYCETLDADSKNETVLSDLLQFTMRDVTASEVDGNSGDIIKVEKEFYEKSENVNERAIDNGDDNFKLEHVFCEDSENVKEEVEYDIKTFVDVDDLKFDNEDRFTPKNMLTCNEDSKNPDVIKTEETLCGEEELKEENFVEMEDQKFLSNQEIKIKSEEQDYNRFEDEGVSPQSEPEIHCRLHKNHPEMPIHKYQTNKYDLKNHLLMHNDPSEMTMYKCDSCSYHTKLKNNLKKHILVHKDPSKVIMYKCVSCSYQTKFKHNLNTHIRVHKDQSEVTMYKCVSCSYQTKFKNTLNRHIRVHKDAFEVTMYKCDSCSFQAKHKCTLKRHLLVHEDPSKVTMFKCDSCLYQTRDKRCLKSHLLVHKDHSEMTMHKCESCSYQTKFTNNLKKHMLVHKDPSEVTMYKCASCSFQTKHKNALKSHLLVHTDPSKVTMYKCDSCPFQTKLSKSIKRHILVHKDCSEVTMYKCDSCSYQTRHKHYLKRHLLVHKDL